MSVVAIVGRANVGKSTLFNRIIGRRQALVSDMPGVTRDRHYAYADWCGHEFELIDTGGLSFDESDAVESKVHGQSLVALKEADVVICLFDAREGVTTLDREVVGIFRKAGKEVVYAVNKIDGDSNEGLTNEFSELGVSVISISAEHGRNVDVVLDQVIQALPESKKPEKSGGIRIALVGRPNVGKSTIINRLANEERVVAHELPGTTRDSIDVAIKSNGKEYIFVDTAGIKKRAKTTHKIDKFSTLKSLKTIEGADVVFVVLDAGEGFAKQDLTLVSHSFNLYKATAVLLNKWDLVEKDKDSFLNDIRFHLKELHGLPLLCISGKSGYNCPKIFETALALLEAKKRRVPTSELNRFFEDLIKHHPPPDSHGKPVKLKFITQVETDPPVFVIFSNQIKGVDKSYKRYLMNSIRELLGEPMVPIVVKFRGHLKN